MANTNTRLTSSMSINEVLITMCEGNPGALTCMTQMIQADLMTGILDISLSLSLY